MVVEACCATICACSAASASCWWGLWPGAVGVSSVAPGGGDSGSGSPDISFDRESRVGGSGYGAMVVWFCDDADNMMGL